MRNAECGMRNGECGMGNAECGRRGSGELGWGRVGPAGEWGAGLGQRGWASGWKTPLSILALEGLGEGWVDGEGGGLQGGVCRWEC